MVFLNEHMEFTFSIPLDEEENEEPQADLLLEVYKDPVDPQV